MRARVCLLALLALVAGCPAPLAERPYAPPTARALYDALLARHRAVDAVRVEARADYLGPNGQRLKLTLGLLAAQGARLRLEADAPIGGGIVAALAADGKRFWLLDNRSNQFFTGPARRCAVAQILRVALSPEDVVAVLFGGVPLDGEPVAARWDGRDGGREVLVLKHADGGHSDVYLDARQRRWDALSSERFDAAGQLLLRIRHEDFEAHGAVRLPARTYIEEPALKADALLKFRDVEVNPKIKDEMFVLQPPAKIAVQEMVCD